VGLLIATRVRRQAAPTTSSLHSAIRGRSPFDFTRRIQDGPRSCRTGSWRDSHCELLRERTAICVPIVAAQDAMRRVPDDLSRTCRSDGITRCKRYRGADRRDPIPTRAGRRAFRASRLGDWGLDGIALTAVTMRALKRPDCRHHRNGIEDDHQEARVERHEEAARRASVATPEGTLACQLGPLASARSHGRISRWIRRRGLVKGVPS
jgi:hypothetical protein